MTKETLKKIIDDDADYVVFMCDGLESGLEYFNEGAKHIYKIWLGDRESHTSTNFDEIVELKMFNGENIIDYINKNKYEIL